MIYSLIVIALLITICLAPAVLIFRRVVGRYQCFQDYSIREPGDGFQPFSLRSSKQYRKGTKKWNRQRKRIRWDEKVWKWQREQAELKSKWKREQTELKNQ